MSLLINHHLLNAPINQPESIFQMDLKLYGITYECPHGKRINDCPLLEIEHLTFKEKPISIDKLLQDKKNQNMNFHYTCSYNRENKCI